MGCPTTPHHAGGGKRNLFSWGQRMPLIAGIEAHLPRPFAFVQGDSGELDAARIDGTIPSGLDQYTDRPSLVLALGNDRVSTILGPDDHIVGIQDIRDHNLYERAGVSLHLSG